MWFVRQHLGGIDRALSTALALWRKPLAVRDSGKILLDLAIMLVLGGDCLADVNLLRALLTMTDDPWAQPRQQPN